MATTRFLLQGLSPTDDHLMAIKDLLSLPNPNTCLISVAFMKSAGVDLLRDELDAVKNQLQLFVGIRNGVTSKQAIQKLLDIGISPICVDTATQAFIFHPKVYLARNDTSAKLIVGSANFTNGGLARNVEASVLVDLDLNIPTDSLVVDSVINSFTTMHADHPENVFTLTQGIDLDTFVNEGLLLDESNAQPRITAQARGTTQAERRSHMRLNTRHLSSTPRSRAHRRQPTQPANITGTPVILAPINDSLLWRSSSLSQRDLNIPTGANTNRTGSMLLKRGDMPPEVDFQYYFRNEVFSGATWISDDPASRTSHIERANVSFRIIIKGIDYGIYTLQLSHNTDATSRTAMQHNALTSLHWGAAISLIARQDLLGGTLCIYAPEAESNVFKLTIDTDE